MNKDLISKVLELVDNIKLGTKVEILKDNEVHQYLLNISEYNQYEYELLCLTEKDTIWDEGDSIEDIKESLICSAVRGRYKYY